MHPIPVAPIVAKKGQLGTDHPHPCNIWQGDFPRENTASDGYLTTAPA